MINENTTAKILEYAKSGFLRDGYRGTSLAYICEQAGVTTGALYHRFPSKDALFRAIVALASNELMEKLSYSQTDINVIIPDPCLVLLYSHWDIYRIIIKCNDAPFYAEFYEMLGKIIYQRYLQRNCGKTPQTYLGSFISKAYLTGFLEIIRCNYDLETARKSILLLDKFMLV